MLKKILPILLYICFIACYSANAQSIIEKKISISVTEQAFSQILRSIENEADVRFFYASHVIPQGSFSLHVQNKSANKVLQEFLSVHNITYRVMDDRIILSKDTSNNITNDATLPKKTLLEPPPNYTVKEETEILKDTSFLVNDSIIQVKDTSLKSIKTIQIPEQITTKENKGIIPFIQLGYGVFRNNPQSNTYKSIIQESAELKAISMSFGIEYFTEYKNIILHAGVFAHSHRWNMFINKIEQSYIVDFIEEEEKQVIEIKRPNHPEQSQAPTTDTIITTIYTPIYETGIVDNYTYYNKESKAHYISIPIGISYPFSITKHVSIYASLYTQLHLLYAQSGYMYSGNGLEVLPVTSILRDFYLSLKPEIQVSYKTDFVTFFGGIHISYSPATIQKSTYPAEINIHEFAVRLGTKISL